MQAGEQARGRACVYIVVILCSPLPLKPGLSLSLLRGGRGKTRASKKWADGHSEKGAYVGTHPLTHLSKWRPSVAALLGCRHASGPQVAARTSVKRPEQLSHARRRSQVRENKEEEEEEVEVGEERGAGSLIVRKQRERRQARQTTWAARAPDSETTRPAHRPHLAAEQHTSRVAPNQRAPILT